MENIFLDTLPNQAFNWNDIGDIQDGRGNLGGEMPVIVYRLMQFAMRDVLTRAYGKDMANH